MSLAETIALTQNPVTGYERYARTLVQARGDILNYKDDDRAMGGYWTSSFRTRFSDNQMYDFFERGLGRQMKSYGYGSRCLHEGMIYEMTLNVPPDQYTISLESMVNEMLMRADYDDDGATERSTTIESAASQARFGTKTRVLGGGQVEGLSVADQAVQTALNQAAFPSPSFARGAGSGEPYLEIFSRGYIYMLAWEIYNQTVSTGTQGLTATFADVVANAQYVARIVTDPNSTTTNKVHDADRKILDIIINLAKLGDSFNNRWAVYMTEGRVLHLAPIPPSEVLV